MENTPAERFGNTPRQDHRPSTTDGAGYEALKEGAGLVDRSDRTVLRLSGRYPAGMLDAILTNELPKEAKLGVYAALLSPKGRVQTDLRVLKSGEDVLVDTEPEGAEAAREILGRYAPFSRVEIEDLSLKNVPWGILGLYGPGAYQLLDDLNLAEHESTEIEVSGTKVLAAGVAVPVPGFDLLGPEEALRAVRAHLERVGAEPVSPESYETARVGAALPRFGTDITPENFPAEAGILDRAVSFSKGCYPGQETVAKMYYRGRPNRRLYRFELEEDPADPAEPGDVILQGEKKVIAPTSTVGVVGWITSVAPLLTNNRRFALGYLSRTANPDAPLQAEHAAIHSVELVGNDSR
jgi:folate-binding protein YgfZ